MKVCPRCWSKYNNHFSQCRHCHIELVPEAELESPKIDTHFLVVKEKDHKIHGVHRDRVTHEILQYDDKGHHEFHDSGSRLHPKVKKHLTRLLLPFIVLIILTIVIIIGLSFFLKSRLG
jgi:hypothetical protein